MREVTRMKMTARILELERDEAGCRMVVNMELVPETPEEEAHLARMGAGDLIEVDDFDIAPNEGLVNPS